ncbi:MAG: DM13 domain-containing protein [Gelidibacter sp.]
MLFRLFYLLFFLLIFGCSSSDDSNNPMGNDSMDMNDNNGDNNDMNGDDTNGDDTNDDNTPAIYQGNFVSAAHETSGVAQVNEDHTILNLNNFMTSNGPIVEVYLATDLTVSDYISLGELQGIDGNYSYNLPPNVDFENYKYVIIWCVEFSVNFGYAILE